MATWQALKPGDVIDLIAPGYAVKQETVDKAIKLLKEKGFVPRVSANLLAPEYFHSNSDEQRFGQLKKALVASDSKAIWCLRGGYGSNRLAPNLLKLKPPKKAKLLIGISDITTLHNILNQKWKWPSLHGALLDRIAEGKLPVEIEEETFQAMRGEIDVFKYGPLKALNKKAKTVKKLRGEVVGGNLTVLQSGIGTDWQLKLKGRFLFIEDIGERGYRVDRMLEQLVQAKMLKNCRGVLFGQFVGGEEPANVDKEKQSRVMEAVERFAKINQNLPMWVGVDSGHDINLRPLPFGTKAEIKMINDEFILSVESGCT